MSQISQVVSQPLRGIVDAHVHVYEAASATRPRAIEPHPWWPDANRAEDMLPVIAGCGVELAVQVTPALNGSSNDYSFEAAAAHPGRLVVFARLEPVVADLHARVAGLVSRDYAAGLRLTLHQPAYRTLLADGALEALWDVAATDDITVAVYAPGQLEHLVRVLDRRPEMRMLIDHGGVAVHPGVDDRFSDLPQLRELAAYPNVYAKVSALCEASKEDYPYRDVHDVLDRLGEWFGAERLIWGSDYPNVLKKCTYAQAVGYISEAQVFTAAELAEVMGGTMHRVLEAAVHRAPSPRPSADEHIQRRVADEPRD